MTTKQWTLTASAVVLGCLSLYLNRDWFAKDAIQIYHRSRPIRAARLPGRALEDSAVNPIVFGFNRHLKLTALKVVALSTLAATKHPHACWDMVSDSNSVPVKDFFYGMPIKGLRPALKGTGPEPLEPGVSYRLFVQASGFKGEHDFTPDPVGQ